MVKGPAELQPNIYPSAQNCDGQDMGHWQVVVALGLDRWLMQHRLALRPPARQTRGGHLRRPADRALTPLQDATRARKWGGEPRIASQHRTRAKVQPTVNQKYNKSGPILIPCRAPGRGTLMLVAQQSWPPQTVICVCAPAAPGSASRGRAARGRPARPPARGPRRVRAAAPLGGGRVSRTRNSRPRRCRSYSPPRPAPGCSGG